MNTRRSQLVVVILLSFSTAAFALERNPFDERFKRLIPIGNPNDVVRLATQADPNLRIVKDSKSATKAAKLIRKIHGVYLKLYPGLLQNKAMPDFVVCKCEPLDFRTLFPAESNKTMSYSAILVIPEKSLNGEFLSAGVVGIVSRQMAIALLNHQKITAIFWDIELRNPPLDEENEKSAIREAKVGLIKAAQLETELRESQSKERNTQLKNDLDSLKKRIDLDSLIWTTPIDEADDFAITIITSLKMDLIDYASTVYVEVSGEKSVSQILNCIRQASTSHILPLIGPASAPGHKACYRLVRILSSPYTSPQLRAPLD